MMSRILDDYAPTAFHGNGFGHPFVDTFTHLALARDIRTVLTVHGLPHLAQYPPVVGFAARTYLRARAHLLEGAHALACPSERVARDLQQLTIRLPEVIAWGIERAPPPPSKRARPFPSLISVGRIVPLKRLEVLIEALAGVRSAWPAASLTIIGPAVDRRYTLGLRRAIAELGLTERVQLAGALELSRCRAAVASADVFVSVSRQESFGLAVLEAVTSGVPTVATNVGIAREILEPAYARLLAPTAQPPEVSLALLDLLSRHSRAREAAREVAPGLSDRFSWRETVTRYSHLLDLSPGAVDD
jgi:glycosyltransferase involved in cell wall biosynthesis